MIKSIKDEEAQGVLRFDYAVGDVVELEDGSKAIITEYGLYDNQYRCEVLYSVEAICGETEYFTLSLYGPQIDRKLSASEASAFLQQILLAGSTDEIY